MALVKWDPFRDVAELQNRINRMFDDSFGPSRDQEDEMNMCAWRPAVDIYETETGVILAVELPGVGHGCLDQVADQCALCLGVSRLAVQFRGID